MRTRFAGWSKNGERQVCNQRIVHLASLLLFYLLSTSLRFFFFVFSVAVLVFRSYFLVLHKFK